MVIFIRRHCLYSVYRFVLVKLQMFRLSRDCTCCILHFLGLGRFMKGRGILILRWMWFVLRKKRWLRYGWILICRRYIRSFIRWIRISLRVILSVGCWKCVSHWLTLRWLARSLAITWKHVISIHSSLVKRTRVASSASTLQYVNPYPWTRTSPPPTYHLTHILVYHLTRLSTILKDTWTSIS